MRLQEGTLGPLYDPDSPGVELGGGGAVGSFEVGPRLDRLLSEQATLTQIMRGFDQQLTAGVDGDQLLTSREFQEALTRLSGAQRELSSCLGAARERIVRDYPMLLSQSRAAAWLLRLVWSCLGASGLVVGEESMEACANLSLLRHAVCPVQNSKTCCATI